jgi:phage terminase small subunit
MARRELSAKHLAFIIGVVAGIPPTQAAIEAGYSPHTASHQASRLLKNVHIAAEIERRRNKLAQRVEIAQADVLREWALIGFSDMRNYVSFGEDGLLVLDWSMMPPEATKAIQKVTQRRITRKDGVVEIKTEFQLHAKTAALDALSKHLGLYSADKARQLSPVDESLMAIARRVEAMSADERRDRLKELRTRALAEAGGREPVEAGPVEAVEGDTDAQGGIEGGSSTNGTF